MHLSFAPMEGISSCIYRRVHREFFPGAGKFPLVFSGRLCYNDKAVQNSGETRR